MDNALLRIWDGLEVSIISTVDIDIFCVVQESCLNTKVLDMDQLVGIVMSLDISKI